MRFKSRQPDFDRFRYKLAQLEALPQLSLLGAIAGLLTALVIALFKGLIALFGVVFEIGLSYINFLNLPHNGVIILPLIGALLIALVMFLFKNKYHRVGIAFVINRLDWHQSRLPLGSTIVQFLSGALAIASGHSVGQEGPAVHLGAGSSSYLGQILHLPNNSLRILAACGTAAAIAAAFDTPVAGVIFALEVLMIEYSFAGFLPVMVASLSSAVFTQLVFGTKIAFIVPSINVDVLNEIPLVILTGIVIGILGTLFSRITIVSAMRTNALPQWSRLLIAAGLTGLIAIPAPDIMGLGYETINGLLGNTEPAVMFLALLVMGKLLASSLSIGLGVPGGLIGPTLFIGGAAGALVAILINQFTDTPANISFHTVLGMGAMLGAVLQAPLTALVTVLEMTHSTQLLFPSLLAIVVAALTTNLLFRQTGIFEQLLAAGGINRLTNPVQRALHRIGVASQMNQNFTRVQRHLTGNELKTVLSNQPEWLLISEHGSPAYLIPAAEIVFDALQASENKVDTLTLSSMLLRTATISHSSSVYDALALMNHSLVDALCVFKKGRKSQHKIVGVVTRDDLKHHNHT